MILTWGTRVGGVGEKSTGGDSATNGAGRETPRKFHASEEGFEVEGHVAIY